MFKLTQTYAKAAYIPPLENVIQVLSHLLSFAILIATN